MNIILSHHKKRLSVLHFDRNAPKSVSAVPGTVVSCLHGDLWITQSGEREDFVVAGGYRYLSRTSGLIVVNAPTGPSSAMVYWLAPEQAGTYSSHPVSLDPVGTTRLVQYAHRLRHQAMGHLMRSLGKILYRAVGSFTARLRIAGVSLMRKRPAIRIDETALKKALTNIRLEHHHAKTHL